MINIAIKAIYFELFGLTIMQRKIYNLESVGEITFEKNSRVKNLRITVKPISGVLVSYPGHVSLASAYKFVEEKKDWIQKSLEKVRQLEIKKTLFNPALDFTTRLHKMVFYKKETGELTIKVSKGLINVEYSNEFQILSPEGQSIIKKAVEFAIRKEAKTILPERINTLSQQHKIPFADLRLKNLRSRWGSCSSRNNINLNIHLVRLPDHLIDYVILHELAHVKEKNHGKAFWKLLDMLLGNAKNLAKEMKNYRTEIY